MTNRVDALRRPCPCGGIPELVGSLHTASCFVRCPRCGCRSIACDIPSAAWKAWDDLELQSADDNRTIWEMM